MGRITVKEENTQTTPPTGYNKLYPKEDSKWYFKNDAGTETALVTGDHAATHKGGGSDEIDAVTTGVNGLMSSADKTKLNGIATGADVTASNAPQAHKASHENGSGDEISVAGLSGVLADEQDAGAIKGFDVVLTDPARRHPIVYDEVNNEWVNESLYAVAYGTVIIADWSPSWDDMKEFYKFIPVNTKPAVTSHVGNGTVSYLNGITGVTGDTYTVTDAGTLTAGSLAVTSGHVVMWYIAQWISIMPPTDVGNVVGGLMVQLSTTTALISPYTDGTDDGKLIGFQNDGLVGVETSQDITITLPDPAGLPYNDGSLKGMFYVGKLSDGGSVTVVCDGVEGKYLDGLESVLLTQQMQQTTLAVSNASLAKIWMRISALPDYLQVRRAATWAATNFSSPTGLPWDTIDEAGNPDVSEWDTPTNTSRIYARYKKNYQIGGTINIDTTGGSTWIFECWLRKNGTTEVPGSRVRTGNYQGEDMAVSLFGIEVLLEVDDYIEWMCEHTSLTGQVYSATLTMSTVY